MTKRPSGFGAFTIMWFGQILSALGTRMTNFVLGIWVWQQTGSATEMALMMFFGLGATVLFSPIAGSIVDRWDRRLTIVLSDVGSIVVTFGLLALFMAGDAQMWHLYLVNAVTGALLAIQVPAYSAAITVMMEKGQYTKANAMMWAVRTLPVIFAPALAAAFLSATDITVILLVDGLTYVVAVIAVYLVVLPPKVHSDEPRTGMWRDSLYGFQYILRRPPLLALQGVLFGISLLAAVGWALLVPLVLARSGGDEGTLGLVQTLGAVGGVLGGVLLGVLKFPRRKMTVVLGAILGFSILGRILYGVGDGWVAWSAGLFFVQLFIPFIDGLAQTIWQEKVEPAVQGRVFAARLFIENLSIPIGMLAAGPLADHVFEPAMTEGGALAGTFGWLVGTGPGAGIGLMFVIVGVLGVAVGAAGWFAKSVREVETLVPDHDAEPAAEPASGPAKPAPALVD
ncbi:MFS transporter [Actinokineospora sp. 24-640]